jgi:hypothetical protein
VTTRASAQPARPAAGRIRLVLAVGILSHLIVAVICLSRPDGHTGDFERYWQLATSPGRPYADFAAEYPPAALAAFTLLVRVTGDLTTFNTTMLWVNVAADATIVALLAAEWGLTAAAVYTWIGLPILSLLYFRFDLWPLSCALGAVLLWSRGRLAACVAALFAGVALKLWPLPFAALLFRTGSDRTAGAPLAWFVSCLIVGLGLWLSYGGLGGLADVVTFRQATGWDIESTVGSVWRAVDPGSIRHESGALRAGQSVPLLSATLFAITLPVALWTLSEGTRLGRLGTGWVAGIGAMLVGSALLSPQFLGWLLPGAAIAWVEGDRRTAKAVGAVVALTVIYRILHTQEMPMLVIIRNGLLIAAVGQAIAGLAAQSRQHRAILRLQPQHPPHA